MEEDDKFFSRSYIDAYDMWNGWKILSAEILLISVATGLYFQSWLYFGITLFILYLFVYIKILAYFLITILSIVWAGVVGFCTAFIYTFDAGIVMGIITFILSMIIRLRGLRWKRDYL